MQKAYCIEKAAVRALAMGHGLGMVSDKVSVEGCPIGYMYRDEPEDAGDSGWRFFAGNESDAYIDNPKNFSLLDVNIIANFDATIVPYLNEAVGAAYDKGEGGDQFFDASDTA